jgi:3-oxoacyl-[acyl-carrier-protein] synthase II
MKKIRVFITGYGTVSHLDDQASMVEALCSAAQAEEVGLPDAGLSVPDSAIAEHADDKVARRMDRFSLLGYIAVRRALERAGVDVTQCPPERLGIIMNTGYGPLDSTRKYIIKLIRDGARKVPAAVFPNTVHNAFTGLISMALTAHGSNSTVSGQNPVCYGFDMIRSGRDDVMLVGGCDELLPSMTKAFAAAGYGASRETIAAAGAGVFARDDSRLILGEGAAVLVLESEASMLARGATPLAELLDYGMANGLAGGAASIFPADEAALLASMRQALQRAQLSVEQVDLLSAASNGLQHVAGAELAAIGRLFTCLPGPLVSGVKSLLGETLGAAAVFSTILAVQAMAERRAPPTAGLAVGCLPPHFVAGAARASAAQIALVNAVELGGTVTSFALAHPDRLLKGSHDAA